MLEPADLFARGSDADNPLFYDPDVHLVGNPIDNGLFHSAWMSAEYAVALVESGYSAEIMRAEAVIAAVLNCQDMDPRSPHYGNFKWEHEDLAVEDLNAVQFVLVRLIPLLLNHSGRLSADLVERVRARIQLGLEEIRRIDVSPIYSNIVAQDISNSILGGQLLGQPQYLNRGVAKLRRWLGIIDQSGIPHEYNSPSYSFVSIEALHKIVANSGQAEARMLAQLIVARIGLSIALRLHPKTGRLAPPHCRAYYPALIGASAPEEAVFSRLIADGILPAWLETLRKARKMPMTVTETSDAAAGVVISSTLAADYSLGVASQELATQSNRFISNQSNVFSIHYTRANKSRPGVVFSRYLINDKWLGDYRTTQSRTNDHIFRDEGSFRGLLAGSRAIGLYTSRDIDAWSRCSSAKAVLIWGSADDVDELWIDGSRLEDLPADLPDSALIVVGCGNVYIAVRPLDRAKLGAEAPARIVERRGSLALEFYNYLGPDKTFWELANPGAFFQGYVHNGFYVEVFSRTRFASGKDVFTALASGQLSEELEAPRTFDGLSPRKYSAAYNRDQRSLGIEVDLMRWRIQRRWADSEDQGFPMLSSPLARQNRLSPIEVADARLTWGKGVAWLTGAPEAELWAAACHGPAASPLTLELPKGRVRIEQLDAGIVLWDKGHVTIDATGLGAAPQIDGAKSTNVNQSASD